MKPLDHVFTKAEVLTVLAREYGHNRRLIAGAGGAGAERAVRLVPEARMRLLEDVAFMLFITQYELEEAADGQR